MKKILIANRGEIACRIIRTAHAMGYQTVAVFSDPDAASPHVTQAIESINIGPAPASQSYLNIANIINAAHQAGADAIHPGYGFLSENAAFAQACAAANIAFIGPPPEAMRIMADKSLAKAAVAAAGVPILPGGPPAAAEKIGYPIMVKALAGGGGRGMKIVRDPSTLQESLASAAREAQSAFGDGALMLEKFIEHGRHIEFQIFADFHGNIIHLGERDCSSQRRHQKIIEESPSPSLSPKLRAQMAQAAIAAARAVNYANAGTIEFILAPDGNFYFLEMNTRLQVEHPVTESVTGLDLVEWQLRIAAGEHLPLTQNQIAFTGHAIQARLCAEDPYENFAPQTGHIKYFRPRQTPIRIESGIEEGGEITSHYDSMVAKFIAHAPTRREATRRLTSALQSTPLLGLPSNAPFLIDLLQSPEFQSATIATNTIDNWQGEKILTRPTPSEEAVALAAALFAGPTPKLFNRGAPTHTIILHHAAGAETIIVTGTQIRQTGATAQIEILQASGPNIHYRCNGITAHAIAIRTGHTLHLATNGETVTFTEASPHTAPPRAADPTQIHTPVSGTLISILPPNTPIAPGDVIAVVEAMKIETRIQATIAGTIHTTHAHPNTQVAAKKLIATLQLSEAT